MIRELVIATRNPHKVREIERLLAGLGARVLSLADYPAIPEIPETGGTFAENARAKATAVARATGKWALADDSGLEIDALGGRPGTQSRRFAGEHATDADRIAKVLALMSEVADDRRTARFHCALAVAEPSGAIHEVSGTCEGRIASVARGSGGFGYDPIFLPAGESRTMAELSIDEKNAISHRGKALRAALEMLRRLWGK